MSSLAKGLTTSVASIKTIDMRYSLFTVLVLTFFVSIPARAFIWDTEPYFESPSYRVRQSAKTPDIKVENHEQTCGFEMNVQIIESEDTIGARILLHNRSQRALDLRLIPGPELLKFFKDEEQVDGRSEFRGRLNADQVVSLFWGFEAFKEIVLQKPSFDFRAEANLEDGSLQCERTIEILRVRDGIVKSYDPFMMGLMIGNTGLRTGELKELGSSKLTFAWGIDVGVYNEKGWGGLLTLQFQDYGGGGAEIQNRMRTRNPSWSQPLIRSYDAGLMASRLFDFGGPWVATYDFGAGFSNFQFGDGKADALTESVFVLGLQHRGSVHYRLQRYRITPFNQGSIFVGFTLAHQLTPTGEVLGQSVSGNSLTALWSLKISN